MTKIDTFHIILGVIVNYEKENNTDKDLEEIKEFTYRKLRQHRLKED